MKTCIWCRKTERKETFNKQAHTIPQSLGGKQICINVCDTCNAFFGARQKHKIPAIETCLKEALAVARFHYINSSKRVKPEDYFYIKPGVKPKWIYQTGNYTSEYFEVDFDRYKFKIKPQFTSNPKLPSIITRQFKRALYKVFLEETERQRRNGLESRFDFIRDFARYDKGDLPVLHFERNSSRFFYIDEFIVHPRLFFNAEGEEGYYKEEYGFFEFNLLGHVFAIATSSLWELNFDTYTRKTLADKAQDFSEIRIVQSFDDLDLFFQRANSKPWDAGLNIPVEGTGYFAIIVRTGDTYVAKYGDIAYKPSFYKSMIQERSKPMAYGEGATVEEAQTKAQEMLFSLSTDIDERVGLQFHFIDTDTLRENIDRFKGLDLRELSDDEVATHLTNIIGPGDFNELIKLNDNRYFYRARRYDPTKPAFEDEAELWAPPTVYTDEAGNSKPLAVGRLNAEGESLLYTSISPATLPAELGLTLEESYYLIRYQLRPSKFLRLGVVGMAEQDLNKLSIKARNQFTWTNQAKTNYNLITGFIRELITKGVKQTDNHLHRATALIAQTYLNTSEIDGYMYPSVSHNGGINIAIKIEAAKQVLEFAGLRMFAYMADGKDGIMVETYMDQSDTIADGKIHYEIGAQPTINAPVDF